MYSHNALLISSEMFTDEGLRKHVETFTDRFNEQVELIMGGDIDAPMTESRANRLVGEEFWTLMREFASMFIDQLELDYMNDIMIIREAQEEFENDRDDVLYDIANRTNDD